MLTIIGIIITGLFTVWAAFINKNKSIRRKAAAKELMGQEIEPEVEQIDEPQEIPHEPEIGVINYGVMIFMLDDNDDDRFEVKRMVKKMGENMVEFSKESTFLEQIPSTPNVYIIDHFLTEMYGFDILRELIKRDKNNFKILYSGTENMHTIAEYNRNKIDRIVDKNDKDRLRELEKAIREGLIYIRGLT